MGLVKTEKTWTNVKGTVLYEQAYGENGKLLKIFTKEEGILPVIARGALRIGSKTAIGSGLFQEGSYSLGLGRSFFYLNDCDLERSHYILHQSLTRLSYASLFGAFILQSLPEKIPQENLYEILVRSLSALEEGIFEPLVGLNFFLKAQAFSGIRPELSRCVLCGKKNSPSIKFSIQEGGLICANCHAQDEIGLNRKEVKRMREILHTPTNSLHVDNDEKRMIRRLFVLMLRFTLDKVELGEFNALRFLRQLGELRDR